jgi:hypothetical protein
MALPDVPAATNVLGTLGAICWSVQVASLPHLNLPPPTPLQTNPPRTAHPANNPQPQKTQHSRSPKIHDVALGMCRGPSRRL